MKRDPIRNLPWAVLSLGFVLTCSVQAVPISVHDNGGPQSGGNAQELTSRVAANDFSLSDETTLTSFTFWASVLAGETFADNFNGTLGWAIFTDNGTIPGTLLFSGQDSAVTTTATGLTNIVGGEIIQVDALFTAGITLDPGTYWLALHEGNWGEVLVGDDLDTEIFWQRTELTLADPIRSDVNVVNPTTWPLGSQFDGAFNITGEVIDDTGGGNGGGDDDDDGGDPDDDDGGNSGGGNNGAIPEPASIALSLIGLAAIGGRRARSIK